MMFRTKSGYQSISILLLMLVLSFSAAAQADKEKKDKDGKKPLTGTPVMWKDPTDIESRNLILGAGGEEMKPDTSKVTFIEQKTGGFSTKYRVRDGKGNEWIAKIGKEAQTDTAANRLVWALGYEAEIAYLIPHLKIEGKGEYDNVRLEARPANVKRGGNWMWENNPFMDKPEFKGLKILMVMLNNWDMKDDNNEILATRGDTTGEGELRYIISDLGGTFGKTGGFLSRSRNKPSDYVKAEFIKKVNGDVIDFNYGGKNQKLFEGITLADARWLSDLLKRLSDEQIKDAFRSANYSAEEVNQLAGAFKARIAQLANPGSSVAEKN
ncbi:MAG TPA: hypothetical protein VJ306_17465 [Pyrinomonadaceae bacterium]|jgi:hypothetical protein|nr:hypothetical protein [Pyrinomonadaceae bacterium]